MRGKKCIWENIWGKIIFFVKNVLLLKIDAFLWHMESFWSIYEWVAWPNKETTLMAILRRLLFHWSAMTWFLGIDTWLRLGRERFESGAIGVTSAFFGTEQRFSIVCAFRNSNWRIVPSKIVIFICQMASCLHRQLAKCKFPIANGE
jgi:hypothetical protein